jgi:hypothetical protein
MPGDRFFEGQMSHVGHRFDLRVNGRPLRVVVVGQEMGWPREPGARSVASLVSLERRHGMILGKSGLGRRYYADKHHESRNPHMRGTTSALRIIFGKGLGLRHEEEFVYPVRGRPFHIFDGFALVNRLLCSAGPVRSSLGRSTRTMRDNCLEHFVATLRILEPTLVVLQGRGVDLWTRSVFTRERSYGEHLHRASFEGRKLQLCTFSHPSARGGLRWGDSLEAPYLREVVVPTLRKAVRHL